MRTILKSLMILGIITIIIFKIAFSESEQQKDMPMHWTEEFNLWYKWKIKSSTLNDKQRKVILDIEKIDMALSEIKDSLSKEANREI